MKVYLAARYSRKSEIRKLVPSIEERGHEVVSRWLFRGEKGNREEDVPQCPEWATVAAGKDWQDINDCDTLMIFTEEPDAPRMSGGRHVETGIAIGFARYVIVVGKPENIFHCLPWIIRVDTWGEGLDALDGLATRLGVGEKHFEGL